MTTPEPPATRYELDQLVRRVEAIDQGGTRGIGRMNEQITQLVRDFARVEGELSEHEKYHAQEARQRATDRRWRIGTTIVAFGVLITIMGLLVQIRFGTH